MKIRTAISFGLATMLVALHGLVFYQMQSPQRDPNGYDTMVLFYYGEPLAIAVLIYSVVALRTTKKRRFWIPIGIGSLPLIGWPTIILLETLRVIP